MAQGEPTDYTSKAEIVTDPARIRSILRRILDSHALLSVTVANSTGHYSTTLVSVSSEDDSFELDELTPTSGHEKLLEERRARVYARHHGVDIRFDGQLRGLRKSDGYISYVFRTPEEVEYHELRAFFRVPIGAGTKIPATLDIGDFHQELRLVDISQGGIGLANSDLPLELEVGDTLPCLIQLTSDEELECEVEIRSVRLNEQTGIQHIGARFHKLTRAQESKIAHHAAQLQRELIRRSAL